MDSSFNKIGINNIIGTKALDGVQKYIIKSPNVLNVARDYYNCSTAEGIELENSEDGYLNHGHWESRTMLGEYMISETSDDILMSEMTAALFKDSGWYASVLSFTGGLFRFGKYQGCRFLNENCIQKQKTPFGNDYCLNGFEPTCSSSRLSKGICYLADFGVIVEPQYQYFNNYMLTGYKLADYCPISKALTGDSVYFKENCYYSDFQRIFDFESSSTDIKTSAVISGCFQTKIFDQLKNINKEMNLYSNCLNFECDYEAYNYTIYLNRNDTNQTVNCTKEGGEVTFDFKDTANPKKGSIYCVDFWQICTASTPCSTMLDCWKKKIREGYYVSNFNNYTYIPNITQSFDNSGLKIFEGNLTIPDNIDFDINLLNPQQIFVTVKGEILLTNILLLAMIMTLLMLL